MIKDRLGGVSLWYSVNAGTRHGYFIWFDENSLNFQMIAIIIGQNSIQDRLYFSFFLFFSFLLICDYQLNNKRIVILRVLITSTMLDKDTFVCSLINAKKLFFSFICFVDVFLSWHWIYLFFYLSFFFLLFWKILRYFLRNLFRVFDIVFHR